MKMRIIIMTALLGFMTLNIYGQCGGAKTLGTNTPTRIGIIIYSSDAETVWNALRFGNFSKNQGDTVNIFLLGKGVELDNLVKADTSIRTQTNLFLDGGEIYGCGTCLKSRKNNTPQFCKFSSMKDLYDMVRRSRILLTF
jgi:hypothetical protein